MIRYYANQASEAVEPVECEIAGFPNLDAKGRKQMENTHYDREIDAWLYLLADAEAGVIGSVRAIENFRKILDDHTKQLVETELEVSRIKRKIKKRFGKDALARKGVEDGAEP